MSTFFHPSILTALKDGWDLTVHGVPLRSIKPEVFTDESTPDDERWWLYRIRVGAVWVMVTATARRQDPKVEFSFWGGYGSTALMAPHFRREDIAVMTHDGRGVVALDNSIFATPALHGQPMSMRYASLDFATGIWEHPRWAPMQVTNYAPKNPNQGGAYAYMGDVYPIDDHDDAYWRAQLMPLGKYPGVFMTPLVTFVNENLFPEITGAAHINKAVRYDPDPEKGHWIDYIDPSNPWRDKAAGGVKCANGEHDSMIDVVCQYHIKRQAAWSKLLILAFTHRWLRQYPGRPKGNQNHDPGPARECGRILKGGVWRLRALRAMGLTDSVYVIQRLARVFGIQRDRFRRDIIAERKPYRLYDADTGYSPPFCGLWWIGLDECRETLAEIGQALPELDYMQDVLAKFCFGSISEVDGEMRILYKVMLDGTPAQKDGKDHYSTMAFYAWQAAMSHEPQTEEDWAKHEAVAAMVVDRKWKGGEA